MKNRDKKINKHCSSLHYNLIRRVENRRVREASVQKSGVFDTQPLTRGKCVTTKALHFFSFVFLLTASNFFLYRSR